MSDQTLLAWTLDFDTSRRTGGLIPCCGGVQVLVPTKELCDQTYRAMVDLTYYCKDVINVQVRRDSFSVHYLLRRITRVMS